MALPDKTWRQKKTIQELASLLRESGERILTGQSKLSLSTGCLSMLSEGFKAIRDEETGNETFEVLPSNSHRLPEIISLQFLYDFIQKTKAFKLTHSNETIQGHVSIAVFRALRSLDLRKIPLHLLRGLQLQRPRLTAIACSRCLRNIQELFETCGGDMSSAMSWPELRVSNLSYNNIHELDDSLRLLPALELINVSHNNISRTDSHLLYLTELRVVNLGYNVIEVIPSFALSSRLLLHTLILRNNNISQLDGLQEMVGLRELDLANNCLCCHGDLAPLRPLKKLRELVVKGNPLSYQKKHRCLTFAFLHSTALKQIVLDGVAISKKELLSCSKQQPSGETFDEYSLPVVDNPNGGANSSLEQSLDYSYDLLTSTADESEVGVMSARVIKWRGTVKRKTKKPRRAEISDVDSQLEEDTACKRNHATTSAGDGHLHMKEKFEVIRNQLGPSWLQSLEIDQSSANENGEKSGTGDIISSHTTETRQTSDSTYQISTSPVETTDTSNLTQSPPNVSKEAADGSTPAEETKSDSHRRQSDSTDGDNVVEWNWQNARVDSVDYGVESEPFIVASADDATNQFLLTVTDRYILEKDLEGEVTEVLDLQCLRSLQCLDKGGNLEDSAVVRLVFDYVRKDRQERKYLLEDDIDVKKLCELLQPKLEDGRTDEMKDKYECMKCGSTFNDSRAKHKFQTAVASPTRNAKSTIGELQVVLLCPTCGSALIVQQDDHQVAPGWQRTASTPIGRFTSPIGSSPVSSVVNSSPRKSLFIKDSECSVTKTTDASTSDQSYQTAHSSSFQLLPNSPSQKGGLLACSFPNSFKVKLNTDGVRVRNSEQIQTDAADMSKVLQRSEDRCDIAAVTTASGTHCHNNNDSTEFKSAEYCCSRNGDDMDNIPVTGQTGCRYMRVNTAESDIVVLRNHNSEISCATDDSDILILQNNPSTVSLGGASLTGDIVINSETDSDISVLPSPATGIDPESETLTSSPQTSSSIDIDGQLSQMLHNRVNLGSSSPYSRSHDPSPSGSLTDRAVNSMVTSMYEKSIYESDSSVCDVTSSDGEASGFTKQKQKRSGPHRNGVRVNSSHTTPVLNGDVFQYCYDDYSQVDHRLKLHLVMKLLAADEEFQLLLRCGVVLPKNAEFPALLVVSSTRLYVLRIAGKQSMEHPDKWLKTVQQQTLTSLRRIEQGLGSQLFHLDFGAVCLTALLRDEAHCQSFTRQLTDVLQEWVFRGTRKPPEVTRVNPSELADLTQNVLLHQDRAGVMDVDDVDTTLLKFVMCHQETTLTGESCLVPVDLIVTPSHMYLATDDTVCRPAASVDASSKKSSTQKAQFAFKARHKLLDLTSIDLYKADPTKAALHFVDECSQEETVWRIVMETKPSLLSLVSSISQPWEREFGVDLQVNVCVESHS